MKKKSNISEIKTDLITYQKIKGKLNPEEKKSVTITGEKPNPEETKSSSSVSSVYETAPITPQDNATIKYLSNVKDEKTGEVSKPFTIGEKKYQMVRGLNPNQEIILGVYCHDDLNESGENIIHPIDYFENMIAKPMKEKLEMVGQDINVTAKNIEKHPVATALKSGAKKSVNLSDFKHFIVNNKTGKVRKFKTIEELAKSNMCEDESYMNLSQFKGHVNEKLFGASRNRSIKENLPTGNETDVEMNKKAVKLMELIRVKIPQDILETIKTPVAKREVIAAFAELIGVPRTQLPSLINQLKDIGANDNQTTSITESKKVIKKIKVKDLINE